MRIRTQLEGKRANCQIKEKVFDLKAKHWYNANVVFV